MTRPPVGGGGRRRRSTARARERDETARPGRDVHRAGGCPAALHATPSSAFSESRAGPWGPRGPAGPGVTRSSRGRADRACGAGLARWTGRPCRPCRTGGDLLGLARRLGRSRPPDPRGPAGPTWPFLLQVTTRSPTLHFDASLTTRRYFFWQAVMVSWFRDVAEPVARAAAPPARPSATNPTAIVRTCTHPPFVGVAPVVVAEAFPTPDVPDTTRAREKRMALRACGNLVTDSLPGMAREAGDEREFVTLCRRSRSAPSSHSSTPISARAHAPLSRNAAMRPARPRPAVPAPPLPAGAPVASAETRPYPIWARLTAALWLLVLGMLIGGTAIPHAQDRPRVVPPGEDVTICPRPAERSTPDQLPPGPAARPVAVRAAVPGYNPACPGL